MLCLNGPRHHLPCSSTFEGIEIFSIILIARISTIQPKQCYNNEIKNIKTFIFLIFVDLTIIASSPEQITGNDENCFEPSISWSSSDNIYDLQLTTYIIS